jgi:hypothetical protein
MKHLLHMMVYDATIGLNHDPALRWSMAETLVHLRPCRLRAVAALSGRDRHGRGVVEV